LKGLNMRVLMVCWMVAMVGCGREDAGGKGGGAGGAAAAGILKPFQGGWKFSLSKTMGAWRAAGVSANEIAQAQAMTALMPVHPDMAIRDDVAVLAGKIEGEYAFYALHPHSQFVCGKAWHHEDRHDPGDMDKYLVRLEIRDGDLWMSVRVHDDAADPSDPEVVTRPLLAGSAVGCVADGLKDPPWSAWRVYVFERGE
jgi:hypothetical protein